MLFLTHFFNFNFFLLIKDVNFEYLFEYLILKYFEYKYFVACFNTLFKEVREVHYSNFFINFDFINFKFNFHTIFTILNFNFSLIPNVSHRIL